MEILDVNELSVDKILSKKVFQHIFICQTLIKEHWQRIYAKIKSQKLLITALFLPKSQVLSEFFCKTEILNLVLIIEKIYMREFHTVINYCLCNQKS